MKELDWKDADAVGSTRLEIRSCSLQKLIIHTRELVSIACPSLVKLDAYGSFQFVSTDLIPLLRNVFLYPTKWTNLAAILTAAPNLEALYIAGDCREGGTPLLDPFGKLSRNLKTLTMRFQAWTRICKLAAEGANLKKDARKMEAPCFEKLERIQLYFSPDEPPKREEVTRLKLLLAACGRLRRVDIILMRGGYRETHETVTWVQALSKSFPPCVFYV